MDDKLTNKVIPFKQACEISKKVRDKNRTVGFASGIFDILHVGHAQFLKALKDIVDVLIVGVDDNKTTKLVKGPDRPYFDETERAGLLSALEFVDYVFIFKGPCSADILSEIGPTYYGAAPFDPVIEYKEKDAKIAGTRLYIVPPFIKSYSTSRIGRMIRFEYLFSNSPRLYESERKGWEKVKKD